ncbi:MAG: hypothetical protein LAN18_01815 [Acidobacteriia bacterium]|nr:hypothetical protein [Terriglobia bacterium]
MTPRELADQICGTLRRSGCFRRSSSVRRIQNAEQARERGATCPQEGRHNDHGIELYCSLQKDRRESWVKIEREGRWTRAAGDFVWRVAYQASRQRQQAEWRHF